MKSIPFLLCLLACGAGDDDTTATDTTSTGSSTETSTTSTSTGANTTVDCVLTNVQPEVLTITTEDGVALEADRYAGVAGQPGFILLHMIPPSNTRADWPAGFINRLTCHGWSVIAIDRRGSGGSDGTPQDSYNGELGKYDAAAAAQALTDIGANGVVLIGASNGTTTALDYAVAATSEGWPEVRALGFMTGGTYTENQHPMTSAPDVPAVFTYSTAEAAWSEAQQPLDPGTWSFLEYTDGDHGTRMFDAKPKVKGDLEAFFLEVL